MTSTFRLAGLSISFAVLTVTFFSVADAGILAQITDPLSERILYRGGEEVKRISEDEFKSYGTNGTEAPDVEIPVPGEDIGMEGDDTADDVEGDTEGTEDAEITEGAEESEDAKGAEEVPEEGQDEAPAKPAAGGGGMIGGMVSGSTMIVAGAAVIGGGAGLFFLRPKKKSKAKKIAKEEAAPPPEDPEEDKPQEKSERLSKALEAMGGAEAGAPEAKEEE